MNAARSNATISDIHAARSAAQAAAKPASEPGKPAAARLADELAVPTPSPVHRLQAGLARLTASEEAPPASEQAPPAPAAVGMVADALYPVWFRMTFPAAVSIVLWAAILRGVALLLSPAS